MADNPMKTDIEVAIEQIKRVAHNLVASNCTSFEEIAALRAENERLERVIEGTKEQADHLVAYIDNCKIPIDTVRYMKMILRGIPPAPASEGEEDVKCSFFDIEKFHRDCGIGKLPPLKPCPSLCKNYQWQRNIRKCPSCNREWTDRCIWLCHLKMFKIECGCGCCGPWADTPEAARDAWNKMPRVEVFSGFSSKHSVFRGDSLIGVADDLFLTPDQIKTDHALAERVRELMDDNWIFYKPTIGQHPSEMMKYITEHEAKKYKPNCYTTVEELMAGILTKRH